MINVPLYLAPKLALYLAIAEQDVSNTDPARRLNVSETVVRRMHVTKPGPIEDALRALGKRIVVSFSDAA